MKIETKYSGADWIKRALKREMSPFGELVADILGVAFLGIYHVDVKALERAEWNDNYRIAVSLGWVSLATWDFATLSMLVVICHDAAVRLSIEPCNFRYVRVVFHPRTREGDVSAGHPTLEENARRIRTLYTVSDEGAAIEACPAGLTKDLPI